MGAAATTSLPFRKALTRQQGVWLVMFCTLLAAVAQVLIKMGANSLKGVSPFAMLTNPPLFIGYCVYGIFTFLFIFALRDGELSVLFPLISLSYIWVAMLSIWLFHDTITWPKLVGISVIIAGVAVLGKEGK